MMNKTILTITAFLLFACNSQPKQTVQTTEAAQVAEVADNNKTAATYTIDTAQSSLAWEGYEGLSLGKSEHNGTLKISNGTVSVQNNVPVSGRFVVSMGSLKVLDIPAEKSGNAKLTGHLLGADFFDAAKFPEAVFEITNSVANGADSAIIKGNLTLKGVTKGITIPAALKTTANTFTVSTTKFYINRKEWGMFYKSENSLGDEMIREEMGIVINLLFKK